MIIITVRSRIEMAIFKGSGVALCTPFTPDGAFNPQEYEKLIDFQVKEGTAAIVSCGTTGEASTLTTQEHIEVVRTAVLAAKTAGEKYGRKVPVIAGAGGNNTAACVEMGKALTQAGADMLMYVTPYYNKTSQKGLIQHYGHIANSVDLPIMVYNVHVRTALNMLPTTLAELAKHPNITAVKEASGDISQMAEVLERCAGDLDFYVGNDDQILATLALGGMGVVSTTGNIAPRLVQSIVDDFFAGDLAKSRKTQLALLPLIRLIFADVNPMPVKAAVNILGYQAGGLRLPLIDIEPELKEKLKAEMGRQGLI